MIKFLKENISIIVLVVLLLLFLKSCGDTQRMARMEKEIKATTERYEEMKKVFESSKMEVMMKIGDDIQRSTNTIMGKKGADVYIQIPKEEKK